MRSAGLSLAAALLIAACSGGGTTPTTRPSGAAPSALPSATAHGATGSPGALPDEAALCGLLAAADFTGAGVQGAGSVSSDSDGPGSAYCVYSGSSGATGGIELDAFVDETADEAHATFNTMIQESGGFSPITLPGADEAQINTATQGGFAAIVVRAGRLSFTVGIPKSDQSQAELLALAALVLARGAAYR